MIASTPARADSTELHCHLRGWPQVGSLARDEMSHLLGGVVAGASAPQLAAGLMQSASNVPMLALTAPVLMHETEACGELWFSQSPVRDGVAEDVAYRCDGQMLYGVIVVDESDFSVATAANDAAPPLQQAARHAYQKIFSLLDRLGYPHLWRVWNYLADINGEAREGGHEGGHEGGLERYRQFNIGRYEAFGACERLTSGVVPAASALGVAGGPLSIAFLAGRFAPTSLENPRQMPAYEYPASYGPRSPTFARAALASLPGQELLFISGTASIVGHATVHTGDVVAQTRETLVNIGAIVDEANRRAPMSVAPWALGAMSYRAYIRHAADGNAVRDVLTAVLGPDVKVMYIEADICRADLLVEVEAFSSRQKSPSAARP